MKLKSQLFLSSLMITLLISILIAGITIVSSTASKKQSINYVNSILDNLGSHVETENFKFVNSFTQKLLEKKTQSVYLKIQNELANNPTALTNISSDNKINTIMQETIKIDNQHIGYFLIRKYKGNIIIGPAQLKNLRYKYPNMKWKKLDKIEKKAFETGFGKGHYEFFDETLSTISEKYAVVYRLPKSNYILLGVINLNHFNNQSASQIKSIKQRFLKQKNHEVRSYFKNVSIINIIILLAAFLPIMLIAIFIINKILNHFIAPLSELTRQVNNFTIENRRLPSTKNNKVSRDIAALAEAFSNIEDNINTSMTMYESELEQQHIVEHELDVARKIQFSVLPKLKSMCNQQFFSLYAKLNSVKEVAGDFYDFFYLDEENIALVVADVSGKGIPAAFFMQKAITLLHSYSLSKSVKKPDEVLKDVNNILCLKNNLCMFVTVFLSFYNLKTGKLTYSNAGHHGTIKLKNGKISTFGTEDKNPALGIIEDSDYNSYSTDIDIDDTLLFYTDGVTDAFSPSMESYGNQRLEDIIIKCKDCSTEQLVTAVIKDLKAFEGTKQFDDITIMAFRRHQ